MSIRILNGDCREVLRSLPSESVHCVVTSPPYWGLRDYGVSGQIGLEPTYTEYVETMVAVFREVRRILRSDGTLWLNLGDSYAGSWGAQSRANGNDIGSTLQGGSMLSARQIQAHPKETLTGSLKNTPGLKPKDLCGIPWRVAFALQADGWYLRQDLIWSKPNPMPESVTDRCTKSHEYLFLLSKSARYYYDAGAVAEVGVNRALGTNHGADGMCAGYDGHRTRANLANGIDAKEFRNKRSVWEIATAPFPEAHFATFPPVLIEPCIKAGTSEKGCCAKCGAPWVRKIDSKPYCPPSCEIGERFVDASRGDKIRKLDGKSKEWREAAASRKTMGWSPTCACATADADGEPFPLNSCIVLDPFGGAGTTGLVADRLGRDAILIELNGEYSAMAVRRVQDDAGMFAQVAAE